MLYKYSVWFRPSFFKRLNSSKMVFFLVLFLLVFPKGGFKLGTVPLTWGYCLLGIGSLFLMTRKAWRIQNVRLFTLFSLLPFQLISFGTIALNGYQDLGMTISFFISFFFLPYAFFLIFSNDIEQLELSEFLLLIKRGVLFIAVYGVFLFFFKYFTGKFVEIPFLTVNWNDLGKLEEKHIDRSGIYKLISTYNNGNLYGVCLLMLLPLYCAIENRKWAKLVVKLSLVLSLSRTVWIGLLFHELLFNLYVSKTRKTTLPLLGTLVVCIGCFMAITAYLSVSPSFLFDANLGGRREQLEALKNPSIFSTGSFYGIPDMIYLGVLNAFGIAGLLSFLFAMGAPLLMRLLLKHNSKYHKCLISGLCTYLIVSLVDGAILLLPTMAFYWFLVSLLQRKALPESVTADHSF